MNHKYLKKKQLLLFNRVQLEEKLPRHSHHELHVLIKGHKIKIKIILKLCNIQCATKRQHLHCTVPQRRWRCFSSISPFRRCESCIFPETRYVSAAGFLSALWIHWPWDTAQNNISDWATKIQHHKIKKIKKCLEMVCEGEDEALAAVTSPSLWIHCKFLWWFDPSRPWNCCELLPASWKF